MKDSRAADLAAIESQIIDGCMNREGDLHALATVCSDVMHRYFTIRNHKIVALALAAAAAGEIPKDAVSIAEYLGQIRLHEAIDLLTGKRDSLRKCEDFADSALSGIGGYAELCRIADGAHLPAGAASLPARLGILVREYRRRQVLEASQMAYKAASAAGLGEDTSEVAIVASRALSADPGTPAGKSAGDALADALSDAAEAGDRRAAGDDRRPTWGACGLDDDLPLRSGGLYLVGARPGGGKTSLALDAAAATARRCGRGSVAFVSLEMTAGDLALILAGRETGIPPALIRDQWERLPESSRQELRAVASSWSKDGSIFVDSSQSTIGGISTWAHARKRSGGLALLVIDYLGLIRPDKGQRMTGATEIYASLCADLKRLALSLDVPVILPAQLTRDGTASKSKGAPADIDAEPTADHLYGGRQVEASADACVLIRRMGKPNGIEPLPVEIIIAKNRRGAMKTILATFSPIGQTFIARSLPTPTPEQVEKKRKYTEKPSDDEDIF